VHEAPHRLSAHEVQSWAQALTGLEGPGDDPERVEVLRALEVLKCAAEAMQAVVAAGLDDSQRAEQAAAGIRREHQGRGVASQVALARRESPHRGERHLGLARVLRSELPRTMAAFREGRITEWMATVMARETACLSLEDRKVVDAELAGDPSAIEAMGIGELEAEAKKLAYRLDAESYVERRRRAERERRVTLRPAPDVMSQLSALLPVKDGVAVLAALRQAADTAIAGGDGRGRGQIMADTLVSRVVAGSQESGADIGVMINLVVSDHQLLRGSDEPGWLEGYGWVPADLARSLAASELAWLRRLYTSPTSGQLVGMEARSRRFPSRLGEFLRLRDRRCRTPWCDAAVKHADHVEAVDAGGETSAHNGQGLCEACNYAKAAVGWRARPRPSPHPTPSHTVMTITPTGHAYRSSAPSLVAPRWIAVEPGRWTLAV
jgi:hypothetical protein